MDLTHEEAKYYILWKFQQRTENGGNSHQVAEIWQQVLG